MLYIDEGRDDHFPHAATTGSEASLWEESSPT